MPHPRGRPTLARVAERAPQRETAQRHLNRVAADWEAWATFWRRYPARTRREAQIAAAGYACYTALHRWQAEYGQPLLEGRADWAEERAA